mmetsp:Transcript_25966/g.39946  ORF Transcript_25966/g.39946 Transcript_25966/m.39946 type:complete len:82 (+) Transcript_25966:911-1156(+)
MCYDSGEAFAHDVLNSASDDYLAEFLRQVRCSFLHILKDEDGYTLVCSKSGDDSQFSTAEQELSKTLRRCIRMQPRGVGRR